ncbi:MAG: YigZ family protein [Bacteroidales bacterium]
MVRAGFFMASPDVYKTIKSISRGLYKEKGSKFISIAFPLRNEVDIKHFIDGTRKEHHDAKHHCYAYVIGPDSDAWRANDDGEPSGTGGKPILGQIRSFGVTNVLVIIPRYFGGTLLGTSGLINAYKSAAASALSNAEIIEHVIQQKCDLVFPYQALNDVMRIIKEEDIAQSAHSFELECRLTVHFRSSETEKIKARFSRIKGLEISFLEAE